MEITLSRAHKIAERLKQIIAEQTAEVQRLVAVQRLRGTTSHDQERLRERAQKAFECASKAERFSQALAKLRAAISKENEARGISEQLARLEAINRVIALKKGMVTAADQEGISIDALASYTPLGSGGSITSTPWIDVVVLDRQAREKIEADLKQLQKEAFALSDQIAEANAKRFTIEFEEEVTAEVTG